MEKWEHAIVRSKRDTSGTEEMTIVKGPDYIDGIVNIDSSQQGDKVVRWLDLLGGEGWQLVSVREAPGLVEWWLKRQTPEPPPEEVDVLDSVH